VLEKTDTLTVGCNEESDKTFTPLEGWTRRRRRRHADAFRGAESQLQHELVVGKLGKRRTETTGTKACYFKE
jgi:hypothetical protein